MTDSSRDKTNLHDVRDALLAEAHESPTRRATRRLIGEHGRMLHQTAVALLEEAELAEHASPPEATLQMISGHVRLIGQGRSWELSEGDLIAIPPERHSVLAREDSCFVLTVRRDAAV